MESRINRQVLQNFVLNEVSEKQRQHILNEIKNDEITRGWYIQVKREHDVVRYLNNEMSVGERFEFEEILKNDTKLRKYFHLCSKIDTSVRLETFREKLNKLKKESYSLKITPTPETRKKKHSFKRMKLNKWGVAASIAILLTISGGMHSITHYDTVEDRLYADYYKPYHQISAHLFNSSKLSEAKRLYSKGEYGAAYLLLDNLDDVLSVQNEKYLYSGMALMELDRHQEAIKMFEKLKSSSGNETDVLIGYWYIGFCYLKIADVKNAVKYFEIVAANNGYNSKKAKKIVKKLS